MNPFGKMEGVNARGIPVLERMQIETTAIAAARTAQLRLSEINIRMLVAMKAARDRLQPIEITPITAIPSQRTAG